MSELNYSNDDVASIYTVNLDNLIAVYNVATSFWGSVSTIYSYSLCGAIRDKAIVKKEAFSINLYEDLYDRIPLNEFRHECA